MLFLFRIILINAATDRGMVGHSAFDTLALKKIHQIIERGPEDPGLPAPSSPFLRVKLFLFDK